MGCAVVQVLFESKIWECVGRCGGVPAFDRSACTWSRAPSGSVETSGSPGRGGCIRPSCWRFCPFPREAVEKSHGGGGDTWLLDGSWDLYQGSLGQLLPPAECGGGRGPLLRSGGPSQALPCLWVPHLHPGEGAVLLGARGIGEGIHGRASVQRLPVGLPGVAVDDTCSVGPCNSQKCHGVLGTLHGPHTCSPARVAEAPGVSVPRGRPGGLCCFTQRVYHVLTVSRVFSPRGHLVERVFSAERFRLARTSAVFKEKFFVMTPYPKM